MNKLIQQTKSIITVCIAVFLLSTLLLAQESSEDSWNKAQAEMKAMFGSVPVMFTKLPMHVRASAWEWFKSMSSPDAAIPPKYGELISLGVAAQIPCEYCVYAHTTMAKMHGATDAEIYEAVQKAADVRHWSTILNGNHVSFESFKSNWDDILAFIKASGK
ncbi:MAG: carboxymuconolactone decarboxylase family protein [Ignavibacterium sp.]|nr:MAG: carboxymuconolactone decarboxylase family protein [Ignavibacterium sp.]